MKLDRRLFIAAGAVLVAGAGTAAYFGMPHENATQVPGINAANAAAQDLSDLAKPPALGERSIGKADAPVTVIEYASATCPHCASFHAGAYLELKKEFVDTGKVRFVFREFPFDDLALAAFMLARCAPEDKYFALIDILFEQQKAWASRNARQELFKIAKLAGFTEESFDSCLKNEEIAQGIIEIREKAAKSYGVNSTPTFFINGKLLKGNAGIDDFRKMIEAELG